MSRRVFLQSLTALLGGFALPVIAQTKPYSPFKLLDTDWRILQISPMTGVTEHLFFPALKSR
jgi:hypothetical protein